MPEMGTVNLCRVWEKHCKDAYVNHILALTGE